MALTQTGHGWDVKSVDWHPTKSLLVSGMHFNIYMFFYGFTLLFPHVELLKIKIIHAFVAFFSHNKQT